MGYRVKNPNRYETHLHPVAVASQVEVAWASLWEYLLVI